MTVLNINYQARVDPTAKDNQAIRRASQNGHIEIVRLLLSDSRVDPSANDNYAIIWASLYDNIEVLKLLLSDYRADLDICAIVWASRKVVLLLLMYGVKPQNQAQKSIKHNLIRDQAIVLNQLPYGPYGRLPALVTCTILSFVYKMQVKELYGKN